MDFPFHFAARKKVCRFVRRICNGLATLEWANILAGFLQGQTAYNLIISNKREQCCQSEFKSCSMAPKPQAHSTSWSSFEVRIHFSSLHRASKSWPCLGAYSTGSLGNKWQRFQIECRLLSILAEISKLFHRNSIKPKVPAKVHLQVVPMEHQFARSRR